jgi:7-cyano-7-deazaguanine synthase
VPAILQDLSQSVPRAVVLLSGGLDSTTVLAIASSEGREIHALSFHYGQRHSVEIEAAKRVAGRMNVASHTLINIDLRSIGGSALTADIEVPKGRDDDEMTHGIPITYVPARNTIFLSFALAVAEVKHASEIFIGVSSVDYSGYPDCRPEFLAAFETVARLGTAAGVEGRQSIGVRAPLQHLSKAQTIALGTSLGVDYSMTRSCYDPNSEGFACGECDSCQLRRKGFVEAGVPDPTHYAAGVGA